jgi:hypothetical protein
MTTRNSVRALALAILFSALPAVAEAQDGWNLPIDRNRMIRAGETKSSSLDGGDRALGDGSYFEAWFFEGRAGQRITVTMRSGAFDTFLAVGRHNADVIETNDDYEANTSTNSQVSITLPADGMYMIRANSLEASKQGDYTLTLEGGAGGGNSGGGNSGGGNAGGGSSAGGTMAAARVLGMPVNNQRMLQSGRQVSGNLDAADGKLDDDSYFEVWYVQLSAGQKVTVTMRSSGFDTFLSLGAHQGSEAAESNDDFEEGSTDSRIEFTASTAGTYVIIANSLEAGMTGNYTLVAALEGSQQVGGMAGDMIGGMSSGKGSAPSTNRVLTLGETRNSELTSEDQKLEDGSYYELWAFQGQAGSRVTITMRSGSFDAYLTIRDAQGNELGKDDDSGGNTDAQVTITIPANGRFAIVANSLGADETGAYTIQVTRAP